MEIRGGTDYILDYGRLQRIVKIGKTSCKNCGKKLEVGMRIIVKERRNRRGAYRPGAYRCYECAVRYHVV